MHSTHLKHGVFYQVGLRLGASSLLVEIEHSLGFGPYFKITDIKCGIMNSDVLEL